MGARPFPLLAKDAFFALKDDQASGRPEGDDFPAVFAEKVFPAFFVNGKPTALVLDESEFDDVRIRHEYRKSLPCFGVGLDEGGDGGDGGDVHALKDRRESKGRKGLFHLFSSGVSLRALPPRTRRALVWL